MSIIPVWPAEKKQPKLNPDVWIWKIPKQCCSSELLFTKETDTHLCHPNNTQQLFVTFHVLWNTQTGIYSSEGSLRLKIGSSIYFFFNPVKHWNGSFLERILIKSSFINNHDCLLFTVEGKKPFFKEIFLDTSDLTSCNRKDPQCPQWYFRLLQCSSLND